MASSTGLLISGLFAESDCVIRALLALAVLAWPIAWAWVRCREATKEETIAISQAKIQVDLATLSKKQAREAIEMALNCPAAVRLTLGGLEVVKGDSTKEDGEQLDRIADSTPAAVTPSEPEKVRPPFKKPKPTPRRTSNPPSTCDHESSGRNKRAEDNGEAA